MGWEGASGTPSVAGSEGRPGLLLLPAQRVAPGACEAHSDVQPRAAGTSVLPGESPEALSWGLAKAQQRGPPDTLGVSQWAAGNHTAELQTSL